MAKKMLIDAIHDEEIRVAVIEGDRLDEFDSESLAKKPIKGNIYLAKVLRVEPSLQAAFVDYGGNKNGFLPFSEIHPDYYHIPVSDRDDAMHQRRSAAGLDADEPLESLNLDDYNLDDHELDLSGEHTKDFVEDLTGVNLDDQKLGEQASWTDQDQVIDYKNDYSNDLLEPSTTISVEEDDEESATEERSGKHKKESNRPYKYKIQEVIRRRQIILVQVTKEERGNKGAALTTYLSLPGRYCVLMPNAGQRSGGISRKISDSVDRQRLKDILGGLDMPEEMGMIIRTAGESRTKIEIKRDFEYLLKLWNDIREKTLKSIAPQLIYAEGDLVKRAVRDMYTREIEEIIVEGEGQYKNAKAFMKELLPSHARKVKIYKDPKLPLFTKYKIQRQVEEMLNPTVQLPSGGALVINMTEALIAIDVNSGRSTRERNIDETAVKTNLEAATEIARQMRLRDLAGIVVIDFIDMAESKHIQQVEKRLRDSIRHDRARIQLGKIGMFGLMTLSRQRLRPNILETNTTQCATCKGTGIVRSVESTALHIMRAIEDKALEGGYRELIIYAPKGADLYLLNQKRKRLLEIEEQFNIRLTIVPDRTLVSPAFHIQPIVNYESLSESLTQIPTSYLESAMGFKSSSSSISSSQKENIGEGSKTQHRNVSQRNNGDGKKGAGYRSETTSSKDIRASKENYAKDMKRNKDVSPIRSAEDMEQSMQASNQKRNESELGVNEGQHKRDHNNEGRHAEGRKGGRRLHRRRSRGQFNRQGRDQEGGQQTQQQHPRNESAGVEEKKVVQKNQGENQAPRKVEKALTAGKPENVANEPQKGSSTQGGDDSTKKKSESPKKWWKRILEVNS